MRTGKNVKSFPILKMNALPKDSLTLKAKNRDIMKLVDLPNPTLNMIPINQKAKPIPNSSLLLTKKKLETILANIFKRSITKSMT